MKVSIFSSILLRRGFYIKLVVFFLSFFSLSGIFFMVITDWKIKDLKDLIFNTGSLCQKNSGDKIIKTSKVLSPVRKKICKLEKEKKERIAPHETTKRSKSPEVYMDFSQYLKCHSGSCHESIGCMFNHRYIRFFETRWLSYKNDIKKKASRIDYLLWENLFVPVKDNLTLCSDNDSFKLKYCRTIFLENRPYDLSDFKKMNTFCFDDDLLNKYKKQKTVHLSAAVSSKRGMVSLLKEYPVFTTVSEDMNKHSVFAEDILPKRMSLSLYRLSFN